MFNLVGKITDTISATFSFLNRNNSPSAKMVFNGPINFPTSTFASTKAKDAASEIWAKVVGNMSEAHFIIEQGINRKWLSDQLLMTKREFEKCRVHFPESLKSAFEKWFYAFQTAFRTKDLYETHKAKEILEAEIQKVVEQ